MDCIQKITLKTLFALIVLFIFMVILSPFYIHRSVVLRLTYTTTAKTSLSVECVRNLVESQRQILTSSETYELPIASKAVTGSLEIPCDNRVGCLVVSIPEIASTVKIFEAALICGGKTYPLSLNKIYVNQHSRKYIKYEKESMLIKPGKKISFRFILERMLKVNRFFAPVAALYMVLLSLIPVMLVVRKIEFSLNWKNLVDLVYSAITVSCLVFPLLLIDYFGVLSKENRFKNKFPDVFIHQRFNRSFPKQLEGWFADRFTGRSHAIKNEKIIFAQDSDSSEGKKVILAKDFWMFFKGWNSVEMYQNKNRFSASQLETCAKNVTLLYEYFRKRNIKLYILLTPDKERVYSEYYPKSYKQMHPESRLEQLADYLTKNTPVKIISPLKKLKEAKKHHLMYFKTGTHWTYRGAYIGSTMLLHEIRKDFPNMPIEQPNAAQWKNAQCADTDIAQFAGFPIPEKQLPKHLLFYDMPQIRFQIDTQKIEECPSGSVTLWEYTAKKKVPGSLRVFAYTDSFWIYANLFMFPATDKMLHAFYGNGVNFELDLVQESMEAFHPDIVIIQSTERFLQRFLTIHAEGD